MKRENLYLVGGALLASTALTTQAMSAGFGLTATVATTGGVAKTSSTTATIINSQVFSSSSDTTTTLGPRVLLVRFSQPFNSTFDTSIEIAGARFKTSAMSSGNNAYMANFDAGGSVIAVAGSVYTYSGTTGGTCTITLVTDKIILTGCAPTTYSANNALSATSIGEVDGVIVSNVQFDNAGGLAASGVSITAGGIVTSGSFTLETTVGSALITSRNGVSASITAAATPSIDLTSSPSFVRVSNSITNVTLGTINITLGGTVSTDLATTSTLANVAASFEVKITSAVTGDDATKAVQLRGTNIILSQTPTQFGSGFVTFTVSSTTTYNETVGVGVDFNGTSLIDQTAAGTGSVTFANGVASSAPAGSGGVAGLNRGGLNIDFNSFQPSVGQGAVTYTSLLRVANTGANAGSVTVIITNDTTGVVLGTYTSASIPSGASVQLSAAGLESASVPVITPSASVLYRLRVQGNITGYAQHVNWNQTAGFFSDLSARRTAVTSAD